MPTINSFDRLFGDTGPLGSVWLDPTVPSLSLQPLHSLVTKSSLMEASQVKSTDGHWRTKMQCKSDPTLQYWKSQTDLTAYISYKANKLNPGTLATLDSCLTMLHMAPVSCILLVIQDVSPNSHPIITLLAAPSSMWQ
jgi:hypothetical protein